MRQQRPPPRPAADARLHRPRGNAGGDAGNQEPKSAGDLAYEKTRGPLSHCHRRVGSPRRCRTLRRRSRPGDTRQRPARGHHRDRDAARGERPGHPVQHLGPRARGARTAAPDPARGVHPRRAGPVHGGPGPPRGQPDDGARPQREFAHRQRGPRQHDGRHGRDLHGRRAAVYRPQDGGHGAHRGAARPAGHAVRCRHAGRRDPLPAEPPRSRAHRGRVRRALLLACPQRRPRRRRARHGERAAGRGPAGAARRTRLHGRPGIHRLRLLGARARRLEPAARLRRPRRRPGEPPATQGCRHRADAVRPARPVLAGLR